MEEELKKYLLEQCRGKMFDYEAKALERLSVTEEEITEMGESALARWNMDRVFGLNDEKTNEFFALGKEEMENVIASRILKDHPEVLNFCPS